MPRGEVKLTEDERSRTSACRPSAEIICFLKVASFPLRLLFWKCIMDAFSSVDLLNLHLTIIKQCLMATRPLLSVTVILIYKDSVNVF